MKQMSTEPYISTYLHSKGNKLGLPISGNFELTARCNFDCPMCYVHLKQEDINAQGKELTAGQWIEIARQAKERGLVFALLTGGEPFARKDFFEIYGAMKDMGIAITINSNGSMLDGEIRQKILDDPPFRMNISLYGGCSQTYQNMCGNDYFERVISNIKALRSGGIEVRLNVSITPYNHHDIARIFELSQELGVQVKATSYMFPPIRVNGEHYGCGNRLSPEDAAKCMVEWDSLRFSQEEFNSRAQNIKDLIAVEESECSMDLNEGISCRAGRSSFWITWDGKMLPCGMMPGPIAYPLETGFDIAWKNILAETKKIFMPRECVACSKRSICPVCAAMCITETGDYNKVPEYACRQTQGLIEETWRVYQEKNR